MEENQKHKYCIVNSHQFIDGLGSGLEGIKWVLQGRHPITIGKLMKQQFTIGGHHKANILDTELCCLLKLDYLPS